MKEKEVINYNFEILSPFEFEQLSRDVMQAQNKIYIESFTSGRDGGIDFRFGQSSNKKNIIQCKRYKSFSSLLNNLKKEKVKICNLTCDSYYLFTSLGLTQMNKSTIEQLLEPYIKDEQYIYGKDDINNLLSIHSEIEKKYYKLWISSTNILNRIINAKIVNSSQFELQKIKDTVKIFVQNDSITKSLKILEEYRFLIISGIPGIGKTTLARYLVSLLLTNNYEEVISLDTSIQDALSMFHEGKKQIFIYDDFLGRNFLEDKLARNEDNLLYKFIDMVSSSNNKILIMTTREYILKQAQTRYELLNRNQFALGKFILDLNSYTKLIKAQILYNHLYYSKITVEYIEALNYESKYFKIINHPNYNPRVIETILEGSKWKTIKPDQFLNTFIEYLDNPISVWEHAFENQISKESRYLLILMVSLGTPVLLDDLENTYRDFTNRYKEKYSLSYNESIFKKMFKEIEGSFIISRKDSYNNIGIDFINPSINDFLINYLTDRNYLKSDLIYSSMIINQYFEIFSLNPVIDSHGVSKKIEYSPSNKETVIDQIANNFLEFTSTSLKFVRYVGGKNRWEKVLDKKIKIYEYILNNVNNDDIRQKISLQLEDMILNESEELSTSLINATIATYEKMKLDLNIILSNLFVKAEYAFHLSRFSDLKKLDKQKFLDFIHTDKNEQFIDDIIEHEIFNVDDDYAEYLLTNFQDIESNFEIDIESNIKDLESKISDIRLKEEENVDLAHENSHTRTTVVDEDSEIHNMFDSLTISRNENHA